MMKKIGMILLAGLLLAGCAAEREFREGKQLLAEGKYEAGLAMIETAAKDDPAAHEYRAQLFRSREMIVNQLLIEADGLRSKGQLDEAEVVYRRLQGIDASNVRARAGLAEIEADRRHKVLIGDADALFKKGDIDGAHDKLRAVLQENPNSREAANLQRRIDEKAQREVSATPMLKASFKKPITLEFRDANLKSVFEVIARTSGINFIFDKDVRPDLKATIFVKNSSIEDAIKLLLVTNQLEKKVLNDSTVLIYPNTPAKQKDYQDLMVKSFYLANTDAKQALNLIKVMAKTKDVFIDEKLNLLVMRDTPEAVRLAEKLLANLDLAEPEVMLEVEVLEISTKRLLELGIAWPGQLSLSPTGAVADKMTLTEAKSINSDSILVSSLKTTINARKEDGDTNLLANPRIRVKNREKAKIHIGDRVPVITTTSTANVGVSESVSYLDVGLKLDVEPNIYLEDEVAIKVGLEVSSIIETVKSTQGTQAYKVGTRNASTVLRLKDGETQVLAGLINDEDRKAANKVPGLGEIPILGRLFGSQLDERNKNEIVLLITPHVVRNILRPEAGVSEFMSGTEANIGASPITLKSVEAAATPAATQQTALPVAKPTAKPAAQQAPLPVTKATTAQAEAAVQGFNITWQGPAQAKVGEPFTLTLGLQSGQPVSSLPLLIGYDQNALQAETVSEGDFLKQGGANTQFSQRIDQSAGRIFIGMGRSGAGASGTGRVLSIAFKPLKPTPQAQVQLITVSPGGEAGQLPPVPLPVVHGVAVVQ